ncbi:MAG TPA: hypothetical protein VMZ22_07945 [Acidimicrobiales bacterium]|nr:hypothetical protein [Acidimicrobiales bacterium]
MRAAAPALEDPTALMLRAALDRSAAAVAGWRGITAAGGLDQVPPKAQWLAPAAYWNLRALGVPESDLVRLKATYRHHWLRNGLALRSCVQTLDGMRTPGLVVGSAAVALTLAFEHGAYPISAVEVVARPSTVVVVRSAAWCGRCVPIPAPADLLAEVLLRHTDWDARSPWLWLNAAAGIIRAHPDLDWSRVDDVVRAAA